MKKEKQVKSYQRRTKSGKTVTVRAHTAKYEAADKAKEAAKKKGAGGELEAKKDKVREMPNPSLPMNEYLDELKKRQQDVKEEVSASEKETKKTPRKSAKKKSVERQVAKNKKDRTRTKMESLGYTKPTEKYRESSGVPRTRKTSAKSSEPSFTAAEFKEWYRGTGSAADKKVAKALRAQLGRSGYRKLEDEAIDNYSSRGHLSMFKRVDPSASMASRVSAEPRYKKMEAADRVARREAENKPTIYRPVKGAKVSKEELAKRKKLEIEYLKKKGRYDKARATSVNQKYKQLAADMGHTKSGTSTKTVASKATSTSKSAKPTITWHKRSDGGYTYKVNGELASTSPAESLAELKRGMRANGYSFKDATQGELIKLQRPKRR